MLLRLSRYLCPFASSFLSLGLAGCDAGSSSLEDEQFECSAPACEETARLDEACNHNDELRLGPFRVLNNLWGARRTNIPGQQCIWKTCDTGTNIAWGTSYDWLNGPAGQVESYTAAILGWHFNTIDPASRLPVRVADGRRVACNWSYTLQNEGQASLNVAYDLWLSPNPTPDGATRPTDEIMIWLHKEGGAAPIGNAVHDVEIAGARWTLYEGVNGDWKVHSFVRAKNAPCAELNFDDFFQYLVSQRGFDATKYLIGIEAGTEIFSAKGELSTHAYSCDIE